METALGIAAMIFFVLVFDAITNPRFLAALFVGGIATILVHAYAPELLNKALTVVGLAGEVGLAAFVWVAPFILCTFIAMAFISVFTPNKQ